MKQTTKPKKADEIRADFQRRGISIAQWARDNRAHPQLVYELLSGNPRRKCLRGQSHRVAVLLGLKAGDLVQGTKSMNVVA